jgi:VWFA-related protein
MVGTQVSVTAVQLYPVVQDRQGRYIPNLTQQDFSVFESGVQVPIDYFSKEVLSLTLAFLLDNSASMDDDLALVQESSCRFLDRLEPSDQVTIYGFNHRVANPQPITLDRAAAKAAIRRLTAAGPTAMYDAVARVLNDLKAVAGRKAIVLFSDGQDNRSLLSLSKVVQMAREADLIIYAIAAGEDRPDVAARADLNILSQATGGQTLILKGIKDLPRIYGEIFNDLRAQYSISYSPPSGSAGVRNVEVRVSDPKYRVRCRKTYLYEPH